MSIISNAIYKFTVICIKLLVTFFIVHWDIVHLRTKNFTIHMETQKTPNNQSSLEKEEWSWRNQPSWLHLTQDSVQFSSVAQSCPTLWPHESQHTRPPCPSPSLWIHSKSHPLSWWCHPAISSSVIPFSFCPQSLPASESFLMSQLFAWGGQSTGVSALASFLPKNTQDWSPLEWTGWISFQSKGLSRVFSNTTVQKH